MLRSRRRFSLVIGSPAAKTRIGAATAGVAGTAVPSPNVRRMTRAMPQPRKFVPAVVAGAFAGCTILLCIAVLNVAVLHTPRFTLSGLFAFDASALVGSVAYSGPGYIVLGVVLHFAVAIGWAAGYLMLSERQPQLVQRPYISGAAFGVLVYFAMQLVLVAANLYRTPHTADLGIALLAHTVFYGVPVAVIIRRARRTA